MDKLRRGQRHGCPDLWTQSGGEDKIVAELAAFVHLKKKIPWNSPMWETLAGKIFDDKAVNKKKWLYTVWNCDRKCIRTRALLRQKKNNGNKRDSDCGVRVESDTLEKKNEGRTQKE